MLNHLELFRFNHELVSTPLKLTRCWPQSSGHLLLEYIDSRGQRIPGQWFANPTQLNDIFEQINAIAHSQAIKVDTINEHPILLQLNGSDSVLVDLNTFLLNTSRQLISHRPGKRAVVRLAQQDESFYYKFFGSEKSFLKAIKQASCIRQFGIKQLRTASIIDYNHESRWIQYSSIKGASLFDLLSMNWNDTNISRMIGATLRRLHESPLHQDMRIHEEKDEACVLINWVDNASFYFPSRGEKLKKQAQQVIQRLSEVSSRGGVLHRDLHDKQILLAGNLYPGFIDFDTLAWGPPALDLANLLVHLELRVLQNKATSLQVQSIGKAIIEGYDCANIERDLTTFLDVTRLRLACVYAFRPRWQAASKAITSQLGSCFAAA